jgi:8-oxo-dGTP pyrophosphatase MutT (NUDIX family)
LAVAFADSYLGRLRARVGSELVLMPGAMVVLERSDGFILLTRRVDDGSWCLPAGAAEPGGSFAATAIDEAREEIGVGIDIGDLIAFGCLSTAEDHTIHYPNGDLTHCFALLFIATQWNGKPRADGEEVSEVRFADPATLSEPAMAPTAAAIELLLDYRETGQFQVA